MEPTEWKRPDFIDKILRESQFNKDGSSSDSDESKLISTSEGSSLCYYPTVGLTLTPSISGLISSPSIEEEKKGVIHKPEVFHKRMLTIRFVTEKISNFYISEISDKFIPGKRYGGAIIYETGTYEEILPPKPVKFWSKYGLTCGLIKQEPENSVKPGYAIILDTSSPRWKQLNMTRMEAQVHGGVIYTKFKLQPSVMKERYGMVFGGFSIDTDSVVKVNSYGLNTGTLFQDYKKEMHPVEADLMRALVHVWIHEFKGKPGVNISAERVVRRKEKEDEWNEPGWV